MGLNHGGDKGLNYIKNFFLFLVKFLKLDHNFKKSHNIKFTILAFFKVQRH